MTRVEPTEALERAETEDGWSRLSMWAALPVALSLLQPKVLATALPGLVASVVVLRAVLVDGRWGALVAFVVVAVGLGVWLGWALVWRHRFRYRLDEEGITVRSGVAYRSEVRLGWERVRNVDVRQAFYFRPLDRVTLVLEGTGGSDEVVTILAVTRDFAEAVRRQVVTFRVVGAAESPASEDLATEAAIGVLHQPRPSDLLVHGALSGRSFALLLAGLGALYSVLNPWVEEAELVRVVVEWLGGWGVEGSASWLLVAVPSVVLLSVLLVAISAVAALVRYWNFALTVDGDRYLFSHGLAETQERSLRAAKLQALTTVETAVGRLFGRCHLLVHKASSATEADGEQSDGTMLVPALTTTSAEALVRRLDPAVATRPHLQPITPAYRRFWLQRLLAVVAAVWLLGLTAVVTFQGPNGPVLVGLSVLAASAAALTAVVVAATWRNWGWALEGTVLFITYGVLGRHHQVFHLDRVQHLAVTRSPYQRRNGLATLTLALPDGDRTIPFLDHADAVELANRTLHKVETNPHLEL